MLLGRAVLLVILMELWAGGSWVLAAPAPAEKSDLKNSEEISSLANLESFSDIVVISKRFLPKTQRFELFGSGAYVLNDPFFNSLGLAARLAYLFTEFIGLEVSGILWGTSERQVTTDLKDKQGVHTNTIISPLSYYGLDFRWTPFYGKFAFDDRSIIPFDFYFSIGGGLTQTNLRSSDPTFHLGTGQIFALSKSTALRWDLSWNGFTPGQSTSASSGKKPSMQNNLYFSFGMSFFFPEAEYR